MRIVVDARMYGPKRWTGIGRYLQNLLQELEQLDHDNEYVVLLSPEVYNEYTPRQANFRKLRSPYAPYSLGEQLGVLWQLWRLKPDLVHFPTPNQPILYFGRHVTTVHDLTLLFHDTSRYRGVRRVIGFVKRLVFRVVLFLAVMGSRQVFVPTRFVGRQLSDYYRLKPGRVEVTTLSVDPLMAQPESVDRFHIGKQYLLYVGNCYPYKNVKRLLEAFEQVRKTHTDLQLVMAGRDDYFRQQLKDIVRERGLDQAVVFTGAVTDGELVSLFQNAAAYPYPSISEGFGLQGLEAMQADVPVVAAQASCLPETCGEAAIYFDPLNIDDMVAKINQVLDDERLRQQLISQGHRQVKAYSWRRTATETLAAYRRALKA